MKHIRTIVVDDETKSRSYLVDLLEEFCPEIDICAQASNIAEAKNLILKINPDLLFLDIELQGGNAFDLLNSMLSVQCPVIFVTAYEEFALKAFKYNAFDYLLKPVDPDDLVLACRKVIQYIRSQKNDMPPELYVPAAIPGSMDKVALPSALGYDLVMVNEIIFIKAESNYCRFHLINKKEVLVPKVLSKYEDFLVSRGFFRVHKSFLVNMQHVVKYIRGEGGTVEMSNGAQLDVSSRKKGEFLQLLHFLK